MRHQLFYLKWSKKKTWFVNKRKEDNRGIRAEKKERIADGEALFSFFDLILVLQFLHPAKFLLILSSINSFILAPFPFGPWSKKGLQIGLQLVLIFKHLAIVSLQTRAKKVLLAAGIPTFTLDIQTGISWASDIKIKWFKNLNLSTRPGLQLWWKSWSEIKSF